MTNSITIQPDKQPASLASLAKKANRAHAACEKAVRSALEHAKLCGETLIAAKELVKFGQFENWLTKHCKFSPRMARRYMLIANGWTKILDLSKRTRASDLPLDSLSVREALRILSSGGPEELNPQYIDKTCPSCGERLAVSSKLYATCSNCWNCKLYRRGEGRTFRREWHGCDQSVEKICKAEPSHKAQALVELLARMDAASFTRLGEYLQGVQSTPRMAAKRIAKLAGEIRADAQEIVNV